jgi:hypothetical protein
MIPWLELEVVAAGSQAAIRSHSFPSRALVRRIDSSSIIATDVRSGGWWGVLYVNNIDGPSST